MHPVTCLGREEDGVGGRKCTILGGWINLVFVFQRCDIVQGFEKDGDRAAGSGRDIVGS